MKELSGATDNGKVWQLEGKLAGWLLRNIGMRGLAVYVAAMDIEARGERVTTGTVSRLTELPPAATRRSLNDLRGLGLLTSFPQNPQSYPQDFSTTDCGQLALAEGFSTVSTGPTTTTKEERSSLRSDLSHDALISVDGYRAVFGCIRDATQSDERAERGKIAFASKSIIRYALEETPDITLGELLEMVALRAKLYRERWPGAELTATALAKNWYRLLTPKPTRRRGLSPEEVMRL